MGAKAGSTFSVAISSSPSGMRFRLSSTKRPNGSCRPHRLRCRGISSMIPRQRIPSREPLEEKRPLRRHPEDHHFWSRIMLAVTASASCRYVDGHEGALCLSPRVFNPLKTDRQRHTPCCRSNGKRNPEKLFAEGKRFLTEFLVGFDSADDRGAIARTLLRRLCLSHADSLVWRRTPAKSS
jgi:hypothetical protein